LAFSALSQSETPDTLKIDDDNTPFLPIENDFQENDFEVFFDDGSQQPDGTNETEILPIKKEKPPVIDVPVTYSSKDSMAISLENGQQIVHLYGGASIKYGSITLDADYIAMNFESKEIYATVRRDSLGKIITKTTFTEGGETFECETLRYNFVTGKGFVENVVTEQQDGFVRSAKAKMMNKDVYCMVDGKYSTCDADHPHFYLHMTKGKIIREKAIITGLSYLVLEDFPIYVPFLPYGYIPTNNKTYSSGVIIPSYGEERLYGFYLREGGFYWAANDYFDLRATGDIYSKGKWAVSATTRYRLRYKFSGGFGFSYSQNVTGERGINQSKTPSFSIRWNHAQDSKASPSQTFSASVDYTSTGFSKENEFDNPDRFLQNSTSSSITYRKDFLNTPLSMSSSMRVTQNTRDSTVMLSMPSLNVNMKSIQPFKSKKRVGKKMFYDDFKLQYSSQFESRITTKESLILSTPYSAWQKGIKHNLPVTFPSFRLFNHINVVPSISYNMRWYFDHIEKYWVDGYSVTNYESGLPKWMPGHVEEVRHDGFKMNYDYSFSLSTSTTLYGMYNMINPNWKLKAVRHKIDPSLSFSYRPDFSERRFGFYDWVQIDSTGTLQMYNMFQNGMYGSASSGRSGTVSFGLNNNIEMKVADTKDTTSTNKFKKVAIFDNLGINSSYNLIAEQFNLSPFSLNARTKIAGTAINVSGSLDPYALNERGQRINEYMWNNATGIARLGRITNISTGYSVSYSSDKFMNMLEARKAKAENEDIDDALGEPVKDKGLASVPEFEPFNMPWRFSLNYTFSYSNHDGKPRIMQSVNLNGSLDLTPKWKTTFSTGYDFLANKITHTKMSVTRDLHCWTMSFDFSPVSSRPYYTFTIRANASMLKDLKVNKTERDFM
jgi:hypothetical protein